MEIIIGLVVLGAAIWLFFIRDTKKPEVSAPYKVETPAPVAEPVKVEVIPAGTEASVVAPAKKAKAPAKKAAAKPKAPAKASAKTAKAKAPTKPKVTVAK